MLILQLKCSLDIEKERNHGLLSHKRHGPERRLDELQQLFLKREHGNDILNIIRLGQGELTLFLAQEQIYGLLQDKYQDRLERFFSKEEMNRTIGNNNNNNSDGLNDQTEQLKSAIKSLEARLLKSETERINNYKKYEMAQAKGTLQSGFTSIHIINVDDQEDRVHYMCSIKKTDGSRCIHPVKKKRDGNCLLIY